LKEGQVIFMGDSAYTRADLKDDVKVLVPTPLPEDGSQPRVSDHDRMGGLMTSYSKRGLI
jgi:hypothetical protein